VGTAASAVQPSEARQLAILLPECQPTQHTLLFRNQRLHTLPRISHHLRKLSFVESLPLRSRLYFDHLVRSRHHKIHIYFSARVLLVAEIEQDFPTLIAATKSLSGTEANVPASTNFCNASPNATNAPVIEAVRVPPSA
jgi:hypothetical protein